MMVERRSICVGLALFLGGAMTVVAVSADPSKPEGETPSKGKASEVELVENLLKARREYWVSLDKLRQYYIANSDIEKTKWAEEEIRSFHRMMKYSYRLDIKDVPPPTLQPKQNIPEANNLFRRAVEYHNKGFGDELLDNQRRSEILFQGILERFPESDKIADVAYHLGDLYENYRPKPQYLRAAAYYERSFQWNKSSATDARLRAAVVYDKHLKMQEKAKELYKAVINHDSDPARVAEAEKRLKELSAR